MRGSEKIVCLYCHQVPSKCFYFYLPRQVVMYEKKLQKTFFCIYLYKQSLNILRDLKIKSFLSLAVDVKSNPNFLTQCFLKNN